MSAKARKSKPTQPPAEAPIEWPRADPAKLAKFDPASKICNMNCGPHKNDPRSHTERLFLCDDCSPKRGPIIAYRFKLAYAPTSIKF